MKSILYGREKQKYGKAQFHINRFIISQLKIKLKSIYLGINIEQVLKSLILLMHYWKT